LYTLCLNLDKINRPSLLRWAIGFLFSSYFSTSKASPNDAEIVIVIIIVVGEAVIGLHGDGIIAQRTYFGGAFFLLENNNPMPSASAMQSPKLINKWRELNLCWYMNPPLSWICRGCWRRRWIAHSLRREASRSG
jgi:hypothetical protein